MENRTMIHQVVLNLRMEVRKEIEEAENEYKKILENHSIVNDEEVQEMKHISYVLKELRATDNWLNRKMIKLEEEA